MLLQALFTSFFCRHIYQSTYSESMKRYRDSKRKMEESQEAISRTPSRYREWLKTGVNAMKNLSEQYKLSNVQGKQNLLVSIFPENFSLSGKNYLTPRIHDVLRYILQINNELAQKIGENFSSNLEISSLVEQRGGKSKHFEEDLDRISKKDTEF